MDGLLADIISFMLHGFGSRVLLGKLSSSNVWSVSAAAIYGFMEPD